jgi:hypothetical protein
MPIIPTDVRELRTLYGFNASNVLTLTNPKVLKSAAIAPTAVLHLLPKYRGSCPAAGSCASLCLNTAGNPAYLKGKLACRKRRSDAFADHPRAFVRLLFLEVLRFASKNQGAPVLGLRLNGTSDFLWERVTVAIDAELADYVAQAFNVARPPVGTFALLSLLRSLVPALQPYDYTKRTDRDWAAAKRQGYHLSLSYGSIADTVTEALSRGLNLAAGFDLPRNAALPASIKVAGSILPVVDGDLTDWRPGDPDSGTHIIGLRIKRTPGQTPEQRQAFCIA